MVEDDEHILKELVDNLAFYQIVENKLKKECNFQGPVVPFNHLDPTHVKSESGNITPFHLNNSERRFRKLRKNSPSKHKTATSEDNAKFYVNESILYLNRYCAKLPSDTL